MRVKLLAIPLLATIAIATSCGNDKPVGDAYRYHHVDSIAEHYAEILLQLDPQSKAMQHRLMDIVSRAYKLEEKGDKQLSIYFRTLIEDHVAAADSTLANEIFGSPRSPFLRH